MSEMHAILMTDMVGSTELTALLGDVAMAALWRAHDRLARDLLRDWRGREIDKSDGFLLLFGSVADGLGYATAYHRALACMPQAPQARVGLHLGSLVVRENEAADVALGAKRVEADGMAKPAVARIMSLALGGQTLLSAEARAALGWDRRATPPGAGTAPLRLQSHGHWRLKGIDEPVELFEAGDDLAPFRPPPDSAKAWRVLRQKDLWLPVREVRHSLPAERDAFVGRRLALQELAQRLDGPARLVSVFGPGGGGKSRLAQHFGWIWLGDFPGGVWFCDLSAAVTLDGILHATAQGLEVSLSGAEPLTQIGNAIAGRGRCMVILDNFEQVARHAAATVGRWLDSAIDARFIVTTRELLGLAGEVAMAVEPLSPEEGETLFRLRAEAASRHAPTADDNAAIAPLVQLLDGLPLAIELAAARVRVLPPQRLLARMGERFRLLASAGGRPDRQSTMRATLAWSWDLLSAAEHSALVQLTVFAGGFSLTSAEQVIAHDAANTDASDESDDGAESADSAFWAADVVQALVDKSLVRRIDRDRFVLLNSVHDYVVERAANAQSTGQATAGWAAARAAAEVRHARHFAQWTVAGDAAGNPFDIDNLVLACRRAVAHGDAASAVATLDGAWSLLKRSGPFSVAVDLARRVRDGLVLDDQQAATAAWIEGSALFMQGRDAEARAALEAGVARARAARLQPTEASLLCALGEASAAAGRFADARVQLDAALALAESLQDPQLQCWALNALGGLCTDLAATDEARAHYGRALALARQLGDIRWQGGLLGNLGSLHHQMGQLALAAASYREALALTTEANDQRWEGNTRCNLGLTLHELGQSAAAQPLLDSALAIARHLGHGRLECSVLCNLAIVAGSGSGSGSGHDAALARTRARALYGEALTIARRLDDVHMQTQIDGYLAAL